MKVLTASSPRWGNAEKTIIDCLATFEGLPGKHWFTADPNDSQAHGRELFEFLKAGGAGPIADWVPPQGNAPTTRGVQKL